MSTFTWIPLNAALVSKPRVLKAKFGDGYEQRVSFGLNTNPQTWTVNFIFIGVNTQLPIKTFLDGLAGVTPFAWTPPGESVARNFTCEDYSFNASPGNVWNVTAVFIEFFG